MYLNKQDSEYASGSKYAKILNMVNYKFLAPVKNLLGALLRYISFVTNNTFLNINVIKLFINLRED